MMGFMVVLPKMAGGFNRAGARSDAWGFGDFLLWLAVNQR
jgi:hypothetical protein